MRRFAVAAALCGMVACGWAAAVSAQTIAGASDTRLEQDDDKDAP